MLLKLLILPLTFLSIQPKQNKQPKCCQCCRCCQCQSYDQTNLSKGKEHKNHAKNIYYYLKENFTGLTQQEINETAKNYLRLIKQADNSAKTLDEITTEKLTPDEIKQHFGIDESINEIKKIQNTREKLIKIYEIVKKEFKERKYTYENSNLKFPRCLVEHKKNNCALEAFFTAMLSDPYRIKFFYLLNYLFEENLLRKEKYPVTFEVCKFFNDAVNHPNFTDTIRCLSISKAFFDNYKNHYYATWHEFGGFQIELHQVPAITDSINDELCAGQELDLHKYDDEMYDDGDYMHESPVMTTHISSWEYIKCNLCKICQQSNVTKPQFVRTIDKLDYSGYTYKGNFINITTILFLAMGWHFYVFRRINNTWINYDSYKLETPTPVSEKFILKLILNSILMIKNFNGHHHKYVTMILRHYDLLNNNPGSFYGD